MSAAAVIGIFSWDGAGQSHWLARLFWHCSLWLSLFSLMSSAQYRVIEQLPEDQHSAISNARLQLLLRIVVTRHKHDPKPDVENADQGGSSRVQQDRCMIYFWQSTTMLMSFSWTLFLAGYAVYLGTPVLRGNVWTTEQTVSYLLFSCPWLLFNIHTYLLQAALIAILVGLMNYIHFVASNSMFRKPPMHSSLQLYTPIEDEFQQSDSLHEAGIAKKQGEDKSDSGSV